MTPSGSRPSLTGGSAASGMAGGHTMTPGGAMQNHAVPTTQTPPKKKPTPEPQAAPHTAPRGRSGGGHHR
jgi:hypothetical protein